MKFKILLLMIPFLAVFFLSFSQTAFAYDIAACVPSGSCNAAYFGKDASCTNVITSLVSCVNPAYSSCEATFLAAGTSCETGGKTCNSGICACPANKPKWYTTSSICVECLSDTDCVSPKTCKLIDHTCQIVLPPATCNNNLIQDNGETGIDCGGGGCADCAVTPVCTSCSDGTLVGACNSAGQRCSEVGGTCSLYTDSSCDN